MKTRFTRIGRAALVSAALVGATSGSAWADEFKVGAELPLT